MPSHKPQKATKCLNYLEIDLKQSKRCVNICTTRTTIAEDLPVNRLLFATIFRNEDNFGNDYAEDSLEENYITLAFRRLTCFIQLKNRTTRHKF